MLWIWLRKPSSGFIARGIDINEVTLSRLISTASRPTWRSANCGNENAANSFRLTGFFQQSDGAEPKELNPPDGKPLQDSELVDTERRNAVQRAIGTLPEKYRAPLILRDVDGRSYDEIAAILETSEGTVKSRISRARGFLREKMRAYL